MPSSCPSVRVRNTGSGYVKPETKDAAADDAFKAKMAERAAQDAALWKPIQPAPQKPAEPRK